MSEDNKSLAKASEPVMSEGESTTGKESINWLVMFKRCVGEFFGTAVLVCIGCGAAMGMSLNGASLGVISIGTALTFGLIVTALSYALGEFTGCHCNPAVTFAMWLDRRIGWQQLLVYTISQVLGAIGGAGLLVGFFGSHFSNDLFPKASDIALLNTYASNSVSGNIVTQFGNGGALAIGFFAEVFFALVFVFTILCTSHDKATKGISGIALGLSLTAIVFFGFNITGTGVNPARSLGTALMALINGETEPIKEIWIFIFGPYVGAALAVGCYWLVWHDHGAHHDSNKEKPTDKIKEHIESRN